MQREINVIGNVTQVSPYMALTQILERKKSPDVLSTNFPEFKKKKKRLWKRFWPSCYLRRLGQGMGGWSVEGGG